MGSRTPILEQIGDRWIGSAEELPGANTQGPTLDEARQNLEEAIRLAIEATWSRRQAPPVPSRIGEP